MKFMRVRFMRRNDIFFICNIYEFHMNFIRGKIGCVTLMSKSVRLKDLADKISFELTKY